MYRVTVEITDTEFIVDLRDNPDQDEGPNNAGRDGATVAAQMLFKSLTDPTAPPTAAASGPSRCSLGRAPCSTPKSLRPSRSTTRSRCVSMT